MKQEKNKAQKPNRLPLEDIVVLDLGRVLPLPFASMVLADLGAQVIKVEDVTDRGGVGRDMLTEASPQPAAEEQACAYNHLARNKKSLALNLRDKQAQEVFLRLARKADVVMESFRPGVVDRLGVGYQAVAAQNPEIIYLSLTAYGQDSDFRSLPGHEPEYCALSGALSLTGDEQGNPVMIGANMADVSGSLHAVIAILAALRQREQTGQGRHIDLSIADCMLSFTSVNLAMHLRKGFVPKRGWQPPYRHVWRTKDDKYLVVTNPEGHLWAKFCEVLGREDLKPLQRPKGEERKRVVEELAQIMRGKNRDEWIDILRQAGVSAAPVNEIDEVVREPHYRQRGMFRSWEHPVLGRVEQLASPLGFGEPDEGLRSFAPTLGQHSEEILKELQYSPAEIQQLRESGALA
ncbi:MAG: CaiB/BaiF CoA-transferase family protein [Desulfarculaceae bacterium]